MTSVPVDLFKHWTWRACSLITWETVPMLELQTVNYWFGWNCKTAWSRNAWYFEFESLKSAWVTIGWCHFLNACTFAAGWRMLAMAGGWNRLVGLAGPAPAPASLPNRRMNLITNYSQIKLLTLYILRNISISHSHIFSDDLQICYLTIISNCYLNYNLKFPQQRMGNSTSIARYDWCKGHAEFQKCIWVVGEHGIANDRHAYWFMD